MLLNSLATSQPSPASRSAKLAIEVNGERNRGPHGGVDALRRSARSVPFAPPKAPGRAGHGEPSLRHGAPDRGGRSHAAPPHVEPPDFSQRSGLVSRPGAGADRGQSSEDDSPAGYERQHPQV